MSSHVRLKPSGRFDVAKHVSKATFQQVGMFDTVMAEDKVNVILSPLFPFDTIPGPGNPIETTRIMIWMMKNIDLIFRSISLHLKVMLNMINAIIHLIHTQFPYCYGQQLSERPMLSD